VAASGLAREAAEAARARGWSVIGCVDDDPTLWSTRVAPELPVVGGIDLVTEHPEALLVVCAGLGRTRETIVERLRTLGVGDERFATLVHPDTSVPPSAVVGAGTVLLAGSVLTADVAVGDHVVCMPHVVLTHDCHVADYATLCANVALGGSVRVGRGAYLGMGATVRERRCVGARATLGMGAVLLEDLPEGETWVGVPAHPLRRG